MKKFFVAMMALCAMAISFTSCNQADPAKEPIAGKTFRYEEVGEVSGYAQFTFHTNHTATIETKLNGQSSKASNFTWEMAANAKNFSIKLQGVIVYDGVYDANAKTITLTQQGLQTPLTFTCKQVN